MEEEEIVREDIADWQQHPVTARFAKQGVDEAVERHGQLMSACAASSDAAVREALSLFRQVLYVTHMMGGKVVLRPE